MGYSNNDTLEQWDLRNVYFSNRYSNDGSALKSDLLDSNNFHCFDLYFEGKLLFDSRFHVIFIHCGTFICKTWIELFLALNECIEKGVDQSISRYDGERKFKKILWPFLSATKRERKVCKGS